MEKPSDSTFSDLLNLLSNEMESDSGRLFDSFSDSQPSALYEPFGSIDGVFAGSCQSVPMVSFPSIESNPNTDVPMKIPTPISQKTPPLPPKFPQTSVRANEILPFLLRTSPKILANSHNPSKVTQSASFQFSQAPEQEGNFLRAPASQLLQSCSSIRTPRPLDLLQQVTTHKPLHNLQPLNSSQYLEAKKYPSSFPSDCFQPVPDFQTSAAQTRPDPLKPVQIRQSRGGHPNFSLSLQAPANFLGNELERNVWSLQGTERIPTAKELFGRSLVPLFTPHSGTLNTAIEAAAIPNELSPSNGKSNPTTNFCSIRKSTWGAECNLSEAKPVTKALDARKSYNVSKKNSMVKKTIKAVARNPQEVEHILLGCKRKLAEIGKPKKSKAKKRRSEIELDNDIDEIRRNASVAVDGFNTLKLENEELIKNLAERDQKIKVMLQEQEELNRKEIVAQDTSPGDS